MFSRSRSRDRSRKRSHSSSREREVLPHRPTDKTSDPGTVNSRIFVGSIAPNITRDLLLKHFSQWGTVVGVSITKNKFGFVQFGREESAHRCLASGYMTVVDGVNLDIKPAKIQGNNFGQSSSNTGKEWAMRGGREGRDQGYERWDRSPRRESDYDSYYKGGAKGERTRSDPYARDYGSNDYYRDYYDRDGDSYYQGGAAPAPPPQQAPARIETPHRSSAYDSIYPQEKPDPLDPNRPNDIEIVVPNKMQRSYAERIEERLKKMDMIVDLLFPPTDISVQRVISDLTERNCLYAIFISAENEKHNSLTLTILHGETQEHRNMPVEEAFRLIQHNFEEYVKNCRLRNMREVVPRDIRNLVLDLLEMRPLSMGDLDKLIKYLRERQNSLVDDQIEQKRETAAGNQPAELRNVAITYPGYGYLTTTVPPGSTAATASATHSAGLVPTGQTAAMAAPVNIVQAANPAMAGIAAASYQTAVAYPGIPGMTTPGMFGAYSMPHQLAPAAPQAIMPQPETKQNALQERILNLMKGQHGTSAAPTGVPTPTAVPAPNMMAQPSAVDHSEVNQTAYNPWSQ